MKKLFVATLVLASVFSLFMINSGTVEAATRVRGYTKKSSGTYVQPHYRSNKDTTKYNNYSTKGNTNPFTGKKGYKSPTPSVKTYKAPSIKTRRR